MSHLIYIYWDNNFEGIYTMNEKNKYTRTMKGIDCDVYDVLEAFNVTCPALQHLLKKGLNAGLRGHKDTLQDLDDIIASAERAKALELERQRT